MLELNQIYDWAHQTLRLSQSFLKKYGITFFGFDRIYDDGKCFRLATHPQVLEHLGQLKLPITVPIPDHLISSKTTYLVPPHLREGGEADRHLQEFKSRFKIGHIVDFLERKEQYYDQIWLFSPHGNDWAANFYLNELNQCEEFFNQFKDQASHLIRDANRSSFQLAPEMRPQLNWRRVQTKLPKVELSPREQQCLSLIALGYTTREMADHLGLSKRTLDHYVDHMKNKLGCLKKSEVISRAIELNLLLPSITRKN